jgi:hypothetical protein
MGAFIIYYGIARVGGTSLSAFEPPGTSGGGRQALTFSGKLRLQQIGFNIIIIILIALGLWFKA